MQIQALIATTIFFTTSCTHVTFHEGLNVPHMRTATVKKQYNKELPASQSFFRPYVTTYELPPASAKRAREESTASLPLKRARTSLLLKKRTRTFNVAELPPASAKRDREESTASLPLKKRITKFSSKMTNLRKRSKLLNSMLTNREFNDFREYNELRVKDGLKSLTLDELKKKLRLRTLKSHIQTYIFWLEQRKSIPERENKNIQMAFNALKQSHPDVHKALTTRIQIRLQLIELSSKNRPLTPDETKTLDTLSKKYEYLREITNRYMNKYNYVRYAAFNPLSK